MANTPNYNLKKVEYTEIADIPGHFNANFDTIDTVMKNNADAAVAAEDNAKSYASGLIGTLSNLLTTAKNNIVEAVNEIFGKVDDVEDDLIAHKAESASKHITESGINANGRYIKFDDGTIIMYMTIRGDDGVGNISADVALPATLSDHITAGASVAGLKEVITDTESVTNFRSVNGDWQCLIRSTTLLRVNVTSNSTPISGRQLLLNVIITGRWK